MLERLKFERIGDDFWHDYQLFLDMKILLKSIN